jgi:hypothetical protein
MIITLNRHMHADDVRRIYQLPETLYESVRQHLPVAAYDAAGTPIYLESHLDRFFDEWYRRADDSSDSEPPVPDTRPADCMIPPDQVQIGGELYGPLTPQQWRFVDIVLSKKAVPREEAVQHVYGKRLSSKSEALRQHCKRINAVLLRRNCPKLIEYANGYYVLR